MLKIAVIGGRETVMGFKALGLEAYPVDTAEEGLKTLRSLTREHDDYAIILIPGREGSLGLGQSALRAAVERAVGTNILGD